MPEAVEKKNVYEMMFLVDPAHARQGEEQTLKELTEMVVRSGGQVVNLVKWADRELAYPIRKNHQKFTRAVYFLGHFTSDGSAVVQVERSCRNSDWIVRNMVICDEDGTEIPGERIVERPGPDDRADNNADNDDEGVEGEE